MTLLVDGFPKLQTLKDVVRQMSKDTRLRTSFNSQHVRESQTLPKCARHHFYHTFHHSEGNWVGKCLS